MSFTLDVDAAGLDGLLDALGTAADEVVRPVAHAGALLIYRRARELAPVFRGGPKYVPRSKSGKSGGYWIRPGQLRDAVYHAYSRDNSNQTAATYHVSWNAKKAPHGHLVEFGTARAPAHSFVRRAHVEMAAAAADAMAQAAIDELVKRIE